MTIKYHYRTITGYPILVYLKEESERFKEMVKQYRHNYAGIENRWTIIQFPNEEDRLAFILTFPDFREPKEKWAGDAEHYLNCEKFPEEVMCKYT